MRTLLCLLVFGFAAYPQTPTTTPADPQAGFSGIARKEYIVSTVWKGSFYPNAVVPYQKLEVTVTIHGFANTEYLIEPFYERDSTGENAGLLQPGGKVTTDANGNGSITLSGENLNGFLSWAILGWAGYVEMYFDGTTRVDCTSAEWVPVVNR